MKIGLERLLGASSRLLVQRQDVGNVVNTCSY